MNQEDGNVQYLCIIIVLLIASYKYLDSVRKSTKKSFSTFSIISKYNERVARNTNILRNMLSALDRKRLSVYIEAIQNVIKTPSYFSKPCLTVLGEEEDSLLQDEREIKKLVNPLRDFNTSNKYVLMTLNEMASDYEALINLSRNSFCKKI